MKRIVSTLIWLVVGAFVAVAALQFLPDLSFMKTESETSNTQIVESITRQEQVVLMSLGIQGISEKSEKSRFFGIDVPGSSRASFIQYSFNAKLGIDGADVRITETGDDAYTVSIPEFIFIGHDDVSFKLAAEKNGALSWVTQKIDSVEMINNILDDEARAQYIVENRDALAEQAEVFYSGIINAINPTLTIAFEFSTAPE